MNQPTRFTESLDGVVVDHLVIRDADVAREARRWTLGARGPVVDDPDAFVEADLSAYVAEAVKMGAHALAATGQAQESQALERIIREVGDKTTASTNTAVAETSRVVGEASAAMTKTATEVRTQLTEAGQQTRATLTTAVTDATAGLTAEVRKVLGGDNPELLERLRPVLDRFGTQLDARVVTSTETLVEKVARQFDPADPTSPMAKHTASLAHQQEQLTRRLNEQHQELTTKVDQLATAIKVQDARAILAKVTPIKGGAYEDGINAVMQDVAAGLGDAYDDTGAMVGVLPRNKKGDGVLAVGGGDVRVVLEMTDSARTGWTEYLDEAERNRNAVAALGLVRTAEQNGGQTIRMMGARRIVMAFDPETDDPDLLRTVVMLLRTMAVAASSRVDALELATVEEKIVEALECLGKVDDLKTVAARVGKDAEKIGLQAKSAATTIRRLLTEAQTSLTGAVATRVGDVGAGAGAA
ncbi:Fis family transcriptional regulator [Nocardioides kribbensis]|uniref:Fis family transcriptional regulator n=1 Tax=Nocardioides kribbensis TaxID=305517 RepID=UPI00187986E0|nr:Fis family transcriptional regulator [Nocardioides kribbensis]